MRQSTKNKLFRSCGDEFTVLRSLTAYETDLLAPGEAIHWLSVGEELKTVKTVIIHEYSDEKDGFEVYIRASGNQVTDARAAMGLSL